MPPGEEEDEPTCPCKKKLPNTVLMLECTECETYYHTICCGLTGLTQMPINKLIANHWKCPRCFRFPEEIPVEAETKVKTNLDEATVSSIVSLVNSTVMKSLKTLISPEINEDSDTEEEETLETAAEEAPFLQVIRNKRNKRQHESIQKAIEEQREEETLIEKKKDNLIIYGMPESDTNDKKKEMIEDYKRLKMIYEGKVEIAEENITHMSRLGIKGTTTRPIQITLADQTKRKQLLTNNMNLKLKKNNESIPIYVSTDRTKKQRLEFKKLREILKERKKTDPNLMIRNNKIVPFREAAQETQSWAEIVAAGTLQ